MLNSFYKKIRKGTPPTAEPSSQLSHKSAVDAVNMWRSRLSHELIFDSGRAEIARYFQAVDHLLLLQSPNSRGADNNPIADAMARLKSEFEAVLRSQSNHAGPVSTTEWSSIADSTANVFRYEDYSISDPPNADVLDYLRNIAERMNSRGKIGDCVRIYQTVRIPFLDAQLYKKLRFQELNKPYNLNRHIWDELKVKIEVWIQLSKICVKKLFEREKHICDRIFQGIGDNSAKDQCFVGTVNEFAVGLFGFVEAMSNLEHEYNWMEPVLALYGAFFSLLQDVNSLFLSEAGDEIIRKCVETRSRIESVVGKMLHDLQNEVLRETSDVSDEQRGVHLVTEYAMEQLDVLIRNKDVLMEFIQSPHSLKFDNVTIPERDLGDVANRTPFQRHLILILVVLQRNLDNKSRAYGNTLSAQPFMMNNLHYIVKKIEASPELQQMIGHAYLQELQNAFTFAVDTYKTSIGSKFLNCFDDESLYINQCCFRRGPSRTAYRNKLIKFNTAYQEIQSLHPLWTIPDAQLRDDVRYSLCVDLVPAYREFLGKFMSNPELVQIRKKDMKHSAEDLEALVLNLFADGEVVRN